MFDTSHSFFDLPRNIKEKYPKDYPRNAGWENVSQVKQSRVTNKF